jgi:hypothetical protein
VTEKSSDGCGSCHVELDGHGVALTLLYVR